MLGITRAASPHSLNDGGGVFTDSGQTLGNYVIGDIAVGDLDGDGDLDIVAGTDAPEPDVVWLNDGAGIFTDSGQSFGANGTKDVELGDVDADGDLDVVVGSHPASLWLNNVRQVDHRNAAKERKV